MRRIKSLRDAEDVVTLLLQLLVIGRRRPARKGQVHIVQFSPTTTISFYCKLQNHGVPMMLCRASLPLLSRSTAAAVAAHTGRNRPARPIAGAVAHCCTAAVAVLVAAAFKLLPGESLCSSPSRCRRAIRCRRVLTGPLRAGRPRHNTHTVTAQPIHAAPITHAALLTWAEAAR